MSHRKQTNRKTNLRRALQGAQMKSLEPRVLMSTSGESRLPLFEVLYPGMVPQPYSFGIQAFHAAANSAVSNPPAKRTLGAPSSLGASIQSGSVRLTWQNNDSSAKGYYVLRSSDGI